MGSMQYTSVCIMHAELIKMKSRQCGDTANTLYGDITTLSHKMVIYWHGFASRLRKNSDIHKKSGTCIKMGFC